MQTLIIRDEAGKELFKVDAESYLLVYEADKRMDVKAVCTVQWAAYATKIADENMTSQMRRAEMEQMLAQRGVIQTAGVIPPGLAPGGRRQMK